MKFAFIDAEKAFHRITKLCSVLEVSRAGFYAWCGRAPSPHAVQDRRLAILVREAHERSRHTYGSPRVHVELAETHGVFVSRKRVIRIMQQEGLRARPRKRFKGCTDSNHDQPVAANIWVRRGSSRVSARSSGSVCSCRTHVGYLNGGSGWGVSAAVAGSMC